MKPRVNLCPCCITLKCLSWLKLQVGILNNYYLPVLVAANGGPRKQVLWPAGADGEGHFLLFASKQVLRPDTKRFHNNQMIHPVNQCVEGFTLWQLVPMAARQPFAALEPHRHQCHQWLLFLRDHWSLVWCNPLSMVEYWFCLVLLALSPSLAYPCLAAQVLGGRKLLRVRFRLRILRQRGGRAFTWQILAGLVPRKKGLVIYPWIWMNFWYFHVSELLEFRDGWPYPTMFWPWYWALTFWG